MSAPTVSVVVPVYNVEPYLGRCLESLAAQTHTAIEVLLVNDGSTDRSGAICRAFAASDPRFVVHDRPNGGLSAARNTGLDLAAGEWVMFLDSDDWIEPDGVERMLAAASRHAADVVVTGFRVDTHDEADVLVSTLGRSEGELLISGDIRSSEVTPELINLLGYAWNKLYRRAVLDHRFPAGVSLVEDVVFNSVVLARASRVVVVPDTPVHYVQRPRETLGSARHPDLVHLVGMGHDAVQALLLAWGLEPRLAAARAADTACSRILWAVRSAALDDALAATERRDALRELVRGDDASEWLARGRPRGAVQRVLAATLARGWTAPAHRYHRLRRTLA